MHNKTTRVPCVLCGAPRARLELLNYVTIGQEPADFISPRGFFCRECRRVNRDRLLLIDFNHGGRATVYDLAVKAERQQRWSVCDKMAVGILIATAGVGLVLLGVALR